MASWIQLSDAPTTRPADPAVRDTQLSPEPARIGDSPWRSPTAPVVARRLDTVPTDLGAPQDVLENPVMASTDFALAGVPTDPRQLELWLQHAAGFILFEDVRRYALARLDPTLDDATRSLVKRAVNDAVYGLMMILDGVSGSLRNDEDAVDLTMNVRLRRRDTVIAEMDLQEGDGMCMGYHRWVAGDFGTQPPAATRA